MPVFRDARRWDAERPEKSMKTEIFLKGGRGNALRFFKAYLDCRLSYSSRGYRRKQWEAQLARDSNDGCP